jgi:nucleoside-diphosphate-sugar epimerase
LTNKVVLLGAASQVGYRLLPLLQANAFDVIAVSRNDRPYWASDSPAICWLTPEQLRGGLPANGMLVSAGPLPLAAEIADEFNGIENIVALSSASIQSKTESRDRREQQMLASLVSAEQRLGQLAAKRKIPLTILRPTLVFGSGLDENLSRLARWIRRLGWLPVAGQASGLRQPIFAGDLASLLLEVMLNPESRQGVVPVAGATRLSYREMVTAIFTALEKEPRLLNLPVPLYAMLLRIYLLIQPGSAVSPEMAARQNRDLLVDTSQMQDLFEFQPAEFRLKKEHLLPPK